jgi:hypothetical protein
MVMKELKMTKISEMSAYELVDTLGFAMTDNCSVHYTLGYMKATLAQVLAALPAADRDREMNILRRVLKDELAVKCNKEIA